MNLIKNIVPQRKWSIKCPYQMDPEFIVVHNTANDAPAQGEISFMISNNDSTSYHYAVDDVCVAQGVPEYRTAWHAGDGTGQGNMNGIGIEICYSKSGGERFLKAEDNAVELIVDILNRYGWGIDRVKKHQDFSGKYCPHRTLDMGWNRFLNKVKVKMEGLTMAQYDELKGLLQEVNKKLEGMDYLARKYTWIDNNIPLGLKNELQEAVNMGIVAYDPKKGFDPMLSEDNIRQLVWTKRGKKK